MTGNKGAWSLYFDVWENCVLKFPQVDPAGS